MKIATFLAAFACLGFVVASPMPTGVIANAEELRGFRDGSHVDGWSDGPERTQPLISWVPARAYGNQRKRKSRWEQTCAAALVGAGCHVGIIHQGDTKLTTPTGGKTSYLNVEGALSPDMKNSKKMRVFQDGSTQDGWSLQDQKMVKAAKGYGKYHQPQEGPAGLLFWDPDDSYKNQRKRKLYWEWKCGQALAREACELGMIHQGESRLTKNGQQTSYVNVVGASLTDLENPKYMHVFQDGSSTTGWSERDRKLIAQAKLNLRNRAHKSLQPLEDQTALLSWSPPDAFQNFKLRKSFWEHNCAQALTRAGCGAGLIHLGETTMIKPTGEKTMYINVEGAPSMGMNYERKMRVFKDGSSEDGWSAQDLRNISQAKRSRLPARSRTRGRAMSLVAEHTGTQAPVTQEHAQHNAQHMIYWDPPTTYGRLPHFKKSWERACHRALEREQCDSAVIFQGYNGLKNSDGTKSYYMNVSAGKNDDPANSRYMRLFEDGSSEWYAPGPLPEKDARSMRNVAYLNKRRKQQQQQKDGGSTSAQGPPQEPIQTPIQTPTQTVIQGHLSTDELPQSHAKRLKVGASTWTEAPAQVPTQAAYPGQSQAPSGPEYQYSSTYRVPYPEGFRTTGRDAHQYSATQTQALYPVPFQSQDHSERQRVGGDEHHYSDAWNGERPETSDPWSPEGYWSPSSVLNLADA